MIKVLLFDFSRVILFPKNPDYGGELNKLHSGHHDDPRYEFTDYFEFDEKLLTFLTGLKGKFELDIFTSGTVQETPEARTRLASIFQRIFSAERRGWSKRDPEAYRKIAELIGRKPSEVMFVDDSEGNVEAARQAGMKGVVYDGFSSLKEEISRL